MSLKKLALHLAAVALFTLPAAAQTPGIQPTHTISPINPTLSPEVLHLIELESSFSQDVAKGGGKSFASWFAEDAVTLSNGQPAVLGQRNIAATAQWDPKDYQLIWVPQGAQISPAGDMGFTWGHYEATSKDPIGHPILKSGRYITIWKKLPSGEWKVALDASADEPPVTP